MSSSSQTAMMFASNSASSTSSTDVITPLREWIEGEARRQILTLGQLQQQQQQQAIAAQQQQHQFQQQQNHESYQNHHHGIIHQPNQQLNQQLNQNNSQQQQPSSMSCIDPNSNNNSNNSNQLALINYKQEFILRKTTVAYGIAELLKQAKSNRLNLNYNYNNNNNNSTTNNDCLSLEECAIDNFMVRTSSTNAAGTSAAGTAGMTNVAAAGGASNSTIGAMNSLGGSSTSLFNSNSSSNINNNGSHGSTNNHTNNNNNNHNNIIIRGIDMISPPLSLHIIHEQQPPHIKGKSSQEEEDAMGKFLNVMIASTFQAGIINPTNPSPSAASMSPLMTSLSNNALTTGTFGMGMNTAMGGGGGAVVGTMENSNNNMLTHPNIPTTATATATATTSNNDDDEDQLCHLFGVLLYELYSHLSPFPPETEALRGMKFSKNANVVVVHNNGGGSNGGGVTNNMDICSYDEGPARKKTASGSTSNSSSNNYSNEANNNNNLVSTSQKDASKERIYAALKKTPYVPLQDLGLPSPICLLVKNLIDCRMMSKDRPSDAYSSIEELSADLHLLLRSPSRFLFGLVQQQNAVYQDSNNNAVAAAAAAGVGGRPESSSCGVLDDAMSTTSSGALMVSQSHSPLLQSMTQLTVAQSWSSAQSSSSLTTTTTTMANNGNVSLQFRKDKLYGRETQVSLLVDAFCRVSTGTNEAVFIGGFPGTGKTRLVQDIIHHVELTGGNVITHKFDQVTNERPMWDIVSMFNNLCLLIRHRNSPQDLNTISTQLLDAFGSNASMLVHFLPNVLALSPHLKTPSNKEQNHHTMDQVNFNSICFTLQLFIRVVSSQMHPVMIFLDDLQWADGASLELVHAILSALKGSSCLFFVGNYRDNHVDPNHTLFSLMEKLRVCYIPSTNISLDGLAIEDLNSMISDALCVFPRISMPLSKTVLQKTKGNPFFVMEFMRSLVDSKMLQYSLRERRWVWDEDKIVSEGITDNVLYLLSAKMSVLPESIQTALKIVSCFGIKVHEDIVGYLSATQHSNFRQGLDQAIREGFIDKVGTVFRFVHDRVREAAYSLIHVDDKETFHFNIGMSLYTFTKGKDLGDMIFTIADQINLGLHSLQHAITNSAYIAELNLDAGSKAFDRSDYITAKPYLKVAMSLLPTDHWEQQYDFSLRLYYLTAKAAYSCGDLKEATVTLKKLLSKGRCIDDKLDAQSLLVTILHVSDELEEAYATCKEVLSELGETIPDNFNQKEAERMIVETSKVLGSMSDEDFSNPNEISRKLYYCLKFYSSLSLIAFHSKPEMVPYFTCRMCNLSVNQGSCEYTIMGFVSYATLVCCNGVEDDISGACRIGRNAMLALKQNDKSASARLYSIYYGFFATNVEPIQSCSDMLKRGFELGMTVGDTSSAFLNACHHMRLSIISGAKLSTVVVECNYYLKLSDKYKNTQCETFLLMCRETAKILMNKSEADEKVTERALKNSIPSETLYFHRVIQSYWIGHSERCHHYAEKLLQTSDGRHHKTIIMFYRGLNAFQMMKRSNASKHKITARNALDAMKSAATHSKWNYRNKFLLLEAETLSFEGKQEQARSAYAAAITASRSSRFVHEQALACELAGFHYKKIGNNEKACDFFNHAKKLYTEWGSTMKADSVSRQTDLLQK